ncbi:MAG: DUF134 domain-containing protein [Tenericutes bacterium]|jgi:predicted DNA-binding protein (UPF0251 family)|nr:DUF134 domain-containing protein [Mycoplasmatota bacterium]
MARPVKSRTICAKPKINMFGPKDFSDEIYVDMILEEFETIRLIDYNRLTQEECASFMGVARTTVQKIYDDARNKIADALINGKTLKIEGGNYRLCSNRPHRKYCYRKNCPIIND